MENFKYKVSVIVPVYNAETYIRRCLESLIMQTISLKELEILVIDDGSTDHSISIVQEYAHAFRCIKIFSEENAGPSVARNFGISKARGKYIMFLDADDYFDVDAIEKVVNFFDQHEDEIDVVSLYDEYYQNEKKLAPHMRYKYLTKTGIYDLKDTIYAMQVRLSICIKNRFEKNIYFHSEMKYQEDQNFCSELLKDKLKLGFVKEAKYNYCKNDAGLVMTTTNAISMFENSTAFFENIFNQYEGEVPQYYQALFVHDIIWKFAQSCLWPYHYAQEALVQAKNRIYQLLNRVDIDVIMKYPQADNYQKLYWIRQKKNAALSLTPIFHQGRMSMLFNGKELYNRKDVEIILKRILIKGNCVKMVGYYKSPFFSVVSKPDFYVLENGSEQIPLETWIASSSYYKAKEQTDIFWAFEYEFEINPEDSKKVQFQLCIDGIEYPTVFYHTVTSPFYQKGINQYAVGHIAAFRKDPAILFEFVTLEEAENIMIENNHVFKANQSVYKIRCIAQKSEKHPVWLYYDNFSVDYDNGYLQFLHDFDIQDGVERYYVLDRDLETVKHLFEERHFSHVVRFQSMLQKILYLNADKILTAFIEDFSLNPFTGNEKNAFNDMFHAEIIYLQHGVLHAHLPWYYTPIGVAVDKVVISTKFEQKNYHKNYGFLEKNILPFGAPRYEKINIEQEAKNRVIFAPSWRSYLISDADSSGKRVGNNRQLFNSNYYHNIMKFLNNRDLHNLLEENDIDLEVKLHPNFYAAYSETVHFDSNRISMAENKVNLADYKLFITDFSSFVFDYAYLQRPILYFVPDYEEFISGMNRYRELDLPYEDAFGALAITPEEAITALKAICDAGFVAQPQYAKRMENFYLPMENPCQKLYTYLIDNHEI